MVFKVLAVIATFALCLNGLRLDCVFTKEHWNLIGNTYACYPATFINDGNSTHILSVTGTHWGGNSNADVKAFSVRRDGLQLSSMPKGIEKFFPNVAAFEWIFGSLTSITSEDLRPFPKLLLKSLRDNKLTSLDGDLFVHTPKVRWVDFRGNQLRNVGYGLLDGLTLISAGFERNPCIDFVATTPTEIQELKIKLRNQCPPLTTTSTTVITTTPMTTSSTSTTTRTTPTTTSTTTRTIPTTTSTTTRTNPTTTPSTTRTPPTTSSTTVSTTTDSGFCSIGCVELIETVEAENVRQNVVIAALQAEVLAQKDENGVLRIAISELQERDRAQQEQISAQQEQASVQSDAIAELHEQVSAQHEQISVQGDAIAELEMQMREFWSSPCSPCVASQYAAQVDQE